MKTRREELEDEYLAGRMEGQRGRPVHFWCACKQGSADRKANPKCKECHGTGVIERGASSHR
jgi:hypothetical protein